MQQYDDDGYWQDQNDPEMNTVNIPSLKWEHGAGLGSWRGSAENIQSRTAHLYNNNEMSDLSILAADENWWYGETVKDFTVILKVSSNTDKSNTIWFCFCNLHLFYLIFVGA